MSDPLRPHRLTAACPLLCPQDSPGKNTGVGSHSLLQGLFLAGMCFSESVPLVPGTCAALSFWGKGGSITVHTLTIRVGKGDSIT